MTDNDKKRGYAVVDQLVKEVADLKRILSEHHEERLRNQRKWRDRDGRDYFITHLHMQTAKALTKPANPYYVGIDWAKGEDETIEHLPWQGEFLKALEDVAAFGTGAVHIPMHKIINPPRRQGKTWQSIWAEKTLDEASAMSKEQINDLLGLPISMMPSNPMSKELEEFQSKFRGDRNTAPFPHRGTITGRITSEDLLEQHRVPPGYKGAGKTAMLCKAIRQGDEMYCAECGLRWDYEESRPASAKCLDSR